MDRRTRPTKPNDSVEPGSYAFHEMVDRSCLIPDLFSREIGEHPAAKHAKLRKRVTRVDKQLFELYQVAATMHE